MDWDQKRLATQHGRVPRLSRTAGGGGGISVRDGDLPARQKTSGLAREAVLRAIRAVVGAVDRMLSLPPHKIHPKNGSMAKRWLAKRGG